MSISRVNGQERALSTIPFMNRFEFTLHALEMSIKYNSFLFRYFEYLFTDKLYRHVPEKKKRTESSEPYIMNVV